MLRCFNEDTSLAPISDSTPQDARVLPSFAELDASIQCAQHPEKSTTLFIFPPSPHVPFPRLVPVTDREDLPMLIHPSPERLHFWAALYKEPRHPIPYIQIRLHYQGPERLYLYYPTNPLGVDPETSRLHASIRAQWILHAMDGVSVAPPAPNEDSAYVNLNYLAIDTLHTMSQTEFGFLLQALVPEPQTPRAYWVSEWTVTCPYCKNRGGWVFFR